MTPCGFMFWGFTDSPGKRKKTSIFYDFYLQAKNVGTSYLFDTELIRRHKNVGILNTEETPRCEHCYSWDLIMMRSEIKTRSVRS